jgi:hypothetical protein
MILSGHYFKVFPRVVFLILVYVMNRLIFEKGSPNLHLGYHPMNENLPSFRCIAIEEEVALGVLENPGSPSSCRWDFTYVLLQKN